MDLYPRRQAGVLQGLGDPSLRRAGPVGDGVALDSPSTAYRRSNPITDLECRSVTGFVRHVGSDRFVALWLLVATTGIRRGEFAGLLRDDIDFVYRRVFPSVTRVVVAGRAQESEPKTSSGIRSLALDPDTAVALEVYVEGWADERRLLGQTIQLLFVWPSGRSTLVRVCNIEGRGLAEGDQRATRPLHGCLPPSDLRSRPARDGPVRGRHRGRTHHRNGRPTGSRWTHSGTPARRPPGE